MSSGVALITGASRGIGRAIALRLAADGYNIALNDLEAAEENLRGVNEEIKGLGRDVIECIADVTKEDEVKSMIEKVEERLGGLDVMVANAGICIPKPFLETTVEDWDKTFNVNGKGVYLCYKYAGQQMVKQGRGGRIIGACSVAGKQGFPLMSIYSATKFVVRSLTQTAGEVRIHECGSERLFRSDSGHLATELAKHGITVNAYAPGFVNTPLSKTKSGVNRAKKRLIQLQVDKFVQDTKKWGVTDAIYQNAGTPDEVAALVSYLASKDARHITGQSININGGRFFD